MLKIGITGGIGSGKTFVTSVFSRLGVPVYNADDSAKALMNTNSSLINQIKLLFGNESYINDKLNRKYIANQIFNNKTKIKELNNIVHPAVERDFQEWCKKQYECAYILKEAAILFESGSYKTLDKTIVVESPKELRIKRVLEREATTRNEIENRIRNQWPTEKLVALADYIIVNNGKKLILPQIIEIDKKIKIAWQNLESGLEQA